MYQKTLYQKVLKKKYNFQYNQKVQKVQSSRGIKCLIRETEKNPKFTEFQWRG